MGPLSAPVPAVRRVRRRPARRSSVDAAPSAPAGPLHRPWRPMVGSEHLCHLLCDGPDRRPADRRRPARRAAPGARRAGRRSRCGRTAILCDDLGVYRLGRRRAGARLQRRRPGLRHRCWRWACGRSSSSAFMPRDLARDPTRTVFAYRGDHLAAEGLGPLGATWSATLTAHLVERYGLDEVRDHWCVRGVERGQPVGVLVRHAGRVLAAVRGRPPARSRTSTRASGSAAPARRRSAGSTTSCAVDAPVDFLSTHIYGSPPLDLRPLAGGRPLLWTEWGVTATHGNEINDTVFAATFLLRGMRSAAGRVEALAPWVASDHFEELGRPPRLLHGGFGLLTVGNLAKPKYWALRARPAARRHRAAGDARRRRRRQPGRGVGGPRRRRRRRRAAVERHARPVEVRRRPRAGPAGHRDGRPGCPAREHTLREWRVDAHARRTSRARWRGAGRRRRLAGRGAVGAAGRRGPAGRGGAARGRSRRPPTATVEVVLDLPMPGIAYVELS